MRKLKLENKADVPATDALALTESRLADIDAEIAGAISRAQQNERELGFAEPEEFADLEAERDRIAKQRAKLEAERAKLEATLPELRKAKASEEWAVERAKQEYLRRQFAEVAAEMVSKAHELREVWERYEAISAEADDLNRRIPARAQRYGRQPLPPVHGFQATNLPGIFLQSVQGTAERVQNIDNDRHRDPVLGKPPASDARSERLAHRSINGETITPPAQPEPAAERPSRSFRGWFSGDLAA